MSKAEVLEPSPPQPRLFIGGLSSTTPTDSLIQLLQRIGATTTWITRGKSGAFAHVSLVDTPESKIDNLIATLNNTTWRGTKISVQRAKEHYAIRLRKEWNEEEQENKDVVETTPTLEKDPFKQDRKGTYKVFPEDFDIFSERSSSPSLEEMVPTAVKLPEENKSVSEIDQPRNSVEQKPVRRPRALDSTMQLFGISTTQDEEEEEPEDTFVDTETKDSTYLKEPKPKVVYPDKPDANLDVDAPDDLSAERAVARKILQRILKVEESELKVDPYRKAGLYRQLVSENDVNKNIASAQEKSNKAFKNRVAASTNKNQLAMNDNERVMKIEDDIVKRSGLYRQLTNSQIKT